MSEHNKNNSKQIVHVKGIGVICRRDNTWCEDKKALYDVFEPEIAPEGDAKPVFLFIFPDIFEKTPLKERQEFCIRFAADGYKVILAGYRDNPKGAILADDADESQSMLIDYLAQTGELGDGRAIICSDGSGALIAIEYVVRLLESPEDYHIRPVAVLALGGMYDLRKFAITDGRKRFKSKVIRAFTGSELRNGIIPEELVPKIREVNAWAHIQYGFPPLFWSHTADDRTYQGQGGLLRKHLIKNEVCGREYKAVHLPCDRMWEFGHSIPAKSLHISVGEFLDAVADGSVARIEYIEI